MQRRSRPHISFVEIIAIGSRRFQGRSRPHGSSACTPPPNPLPFLHRRSRAFATAFLPGKRSQPSARRLQNRGAAKSSHEIRRRGCSPAPQNGPAQFSSPPNPLPAPTAAQRNSLHRRSHAFAMAFLPGKRSQLSADFKTAARPNCKQASAPGTAPIRRHLIKPPPDGFPPLCRPRPGGAHPPAKRLSRPKKNRRPHPSGRRAAIRAYSMVGASTPRDFCRQSIKKP